MKLRTLVHVVAAISAALLLLLATGLARYYRNSSAAVTDGRVVDKLQAGINELRFVMVETILYETPRSEEQWGQKHASLLAILGRKAVHSPHERLLLGRIRANLAIAGTLYNRLTALASGRAGQPWAADSGSAKEARTRTVSSMLLVTQDMLDDAEELSRINQNTILATQRVEEKLVLLTLLLVGAIVGWIWWLIRFRVLSPIAALQQGTALVAAGRLEHRLGLRGEDEIGSLARAFDAMTEQLQSSRDQLSASEEHYRLTMEASSVGMWDIDLPSGRIVCDPHWYQMLGFEPGAFSMSLDEWHSRLHPEDREATRAKIRDLLPSRETESFEFRFRDGNDHWRWLQWRGRVVQWQEGEPLRVVGTHTDVTARKTAELALLESEALKASVLEHAAYAIVATDAQGLITVFNPGAEILLGYRAEELVGKQTPVIFHDPEEVRARAEALSRELGMVVEPGLDAFVTKTRMTGKPDENEWTYVRKDGTRVPALLSVTARTDAQGQLVGYLGISLDISERKAFEAKIHDLAYYDPLTQLPNRRLLLDRLGLALPGSARRNAYGAILFLDLDNFKTLNDTLGHEYGDLLLMEVAKRLLSCVRTEDTVARQGGDEFIVMLEDLSPEVQQAVAQAEAIGEKIRAALGVEYRLREHRHHCTCSIGISLFKGSDVDVGELLKRADMAMYQAKAAGRDTLRFFRGE